MLFDSVYRNAEKYYPTFFLGKFSHSFFGEV